MPRGVAAIEQTVVDFLEQMLEPWPPPLLKNVGVLPLLWLGSFLLLPWLAETAKSWAAAVAMEAE